MEAWNSHILGEFLDIKYGKDHKKLNDGLVPCYGTGGIMRYVDSQLSNNESILIPRKGSLNNIYYINVPFWTVDTLFWTMIDTSKVDAKFLFYQLKLVDFTTLNVGSAVPSLTVPVLEALDVLLPPLPEQKAIAGVLSALDDKIDLLHRQNKTLESLAETLFRQWFIEDAQDDWEYVELGNHVTVVDNRGKTPPNQKEKTEHPIIEVNALGSMDRLVNYSVIKKYVQSDVFNNWFRGCPQKYDLLISTVGSIGEISMFLWENGNIAQNVVALHTKGLSPFFLYQIIQYKLTEIRQLDIGAVQPSIKVPHLLSVIIPIPDKEVLLAFDTHLLAYVEKLETNQKQIQTLENLRDTLLPKLMSGAVRVRFEEAG